MKKSIVTAILLFSATSILPMRPPLLKTSSQLAQQLIRSGGQRNFFEYIDTATVFIGVGVLVGNFKLGHNLKDNKLKMLSHFDGDKIKKLIKDHPILSEARTDLGSSYYGLFLTGCSYAAIHDTPLVAIPALAALVSSQYTMEGFQSFLIEKEKIDELIAQDKESTK